jgi:hypothetical protein
MLGRQFADRLRLAVNEFRAELNGDFEVRRVLGQDPPAEARTSFEHDDRAARLAEFRSAREAGRAGADDYDVEERGQVRVRTAKVTKSEGNERRRQRTASDACSSERRLSSSTRSTATSPIDDD